MDSVFLTTAWFSQNCIELSLSYSDAADTEQPVWGLSHHLGPRHDHIWCDWCMMLCSKQCLRFRKTCSVISSLKSIKYNSDSEELMVIHRLTLSQLFDLCSRLYCQGMRERELSNNEASATGNNCIAIVVSKKTKIVSICFYKSIIILCDQLLSVQAV